MASEFFVTCLPLPVRGRRKDRMLVAPVEYAEKRPQVQPERPGLPCAIGLRLIRALLGVPGFLATVACPAKDLAGLIPASGDRDHTILPSASPVLVSHSQSVHRLPPQRP